jgi:uncharacterized small protein (DUF1192 family)
MSDPFAEDLPKKRKTQHEVGSDLSSLSIDELTDRIGDLKKEVERLEAEITRKRSVQSAADAIFRSR